MKFTLLACLVIAGSLWFGHVVNLGLGWTPIVIGLIIGTIIAVMQIIDEETKTKDT